MNAHADEHFAGSNKLFISIWVWLVVLTLIEILLAYRPMAIHFMLTILLGLSICICLLLVFFPDSFRSAGLRYQFKQPAPVAPASEEP